MNEATDDPGKLTDAQSESKDEHVTTVGEAMRIAERIWWKNNLYSRQGLTHLFPGLLRPRGVKKVSSST